MRMRELKALKKGQRVTVTGTEDGKYFVNEPGVVSETNYDRVRIAFDTWSEGHGINDNEWYFSDAPRVNITVVEPVVAPKAKKAPHGKQEYKGNGKHSWEHVVGVTERLRVPGGWLYKTTAATSSMAFVPVPEVVGYAI